MSAAWFVDGSYAYKCWKNVAGGRGLDYAKLREAIERDAGEPLRENYFFNAEGSPPTAAQDSFHRRIATPAPEGGGLRLMLYWTDTRKVFWPERFGGHPVMHPTIPDLQFEKETQKGVDVGLGYHLARSYNRKGWDKLYLMAGDGDFGEVVQDFVKHEGVDVVLLGTRRTISSELGPWCRPIYLEDHVEVLALPVRAQHNAEA